MDLILTRGANRSKTIDLNEERVTVGTVLRSDHELTSSKKMIEGRIAYA